MQQAIDLKKFKLKYNQIQFLNDADKETFLLASHGVNASTKLLYRFIELYASQGLITLSNYAMMKETGLSEEAIKAELRRLEMVGIITCKYEQDGIEVTRHNYDKTKRLTRTQIVLHLDKALEYVNYTVYDQEYKTACKRGLLRRIARQFPIMIKGLIEYLINKAKQAKDEALIARYQARQNNYHKHLKWHLKKHKRYSDAPLYELHNLSQDDLDLINDKLVSLGTKTLPGRSISSESRRLLFTIPDDLTYDPLTQSFITK